MEHALSTLLYILNFNRPENYKSLKFFVGWNKAADVHMSNSCKCVIDWKGYSSAQVYFCFRFTPAPIYLCNSASEHTQP